MIRTLSLLALGLTLAACRPGTDAAGTLPSGEAMPATYDWHFVEHGGSGNLDYGDGDWAEGGRVFQLSCLPRSRSVEMSWGEPGEAVLTSGTATGTFEAYAKAPTDHPVFAALKASGAISVGLSGADMTLTAKEAGQAEIAAFFHYCNNGVDPRMTGPAADAGVAI